MLELLQRHGDRALAIGLVIAVWIEAVVIGTVPGEGSLAPTSEALAFATISGVLVAGSVAWRATVPLIGLALAMLAAVAAVTAPHDAPVAVVVAMVIASYSVAAHTRATSAVIGGLGVVALVAVAIAKDMGPEPVVGDLSVPILIFGGPWLAGMSIRSRREREALLEHARVEEARAAVADERARISRELHDAVAHAIGVVVLQARGARRTIVTDRAAATEALDAIEATGAQALAEMRRLVGVLRRDDEGMALAPPPSLRHLGALVDRVREAGLPVKVSVEGIATDLPPGIDLSAYRIVQEALTNVLTHAGPATATVVIRYLEDGLELEIADTGQGRRRSTIDGHGLIGMRERVTLYQGTLVADSRSGGGFVIRARLPFGATAT